MLKAAIVTDIHAGPDIYSSQGLKIKEGTRVPQFLEHFVGAVNESDAQCVVDMGDRVSSRSVIEDQQNMAIVQSHMDNLDVPLYYVPGNNEYRNLDAAEIERLTGQPTQTHSQTIGGVHLVFWNPNVDLSHGLTLSDDDIDALKTTLSLEPDMPTIIFTHVPLDNNSERHQRILAQTDNPEANAKRLTYDKYHYTNAHEARKIMEEHGHVIMAFGGHRHRTKHKQINGIQYITLDSPVSLHKPDWQARQTFAFIEVDPDQKTAVVDIQGRTGERLEFSF